LETKILSNLVHNESFARKVLPFLKGDYFHDNSENLIYEEIGGFVERYNEIPTIDVLRVEFNQKTNLSDDQYSNVIDYLKEIYDKDDSSEEWLLTSTEKFCQEKAVYNALMESISIVDGKDDEKGEGEIPKILTEALSVSFDPNVGHDYFEDSDVRFDFYHKVEEKVKFDLELFNSITKGGLPKKSLNICLAGTGVGKSMFMCHQAAGCLKDGKDVLYITLEMAEERIAERIDANLLDIALDDMIALPRESFNKKIENERQKTVGNLIIKEYPTAVAHVGHFRHLLNELRLKKTFIPDIIFIDYLNICSSSRIKANANANSYTLVKSIAEELRGLAVEKNVPIMSATQTTRSGYANSDVELTDTSESFGLPTTADFMFALIVTEELEELNQIMVKQLKNRYNDPTMHKRFIIGCDRSKMRLYDVENEAQDLHDSSSSEEFVMPDFGNKNSGNWDGLKL
tara:strand:+ start:1846 stop:3219 length:1374 start_codon:yes stop_codon:yes gene_type:complete